MTPGGRWGGFLRTSAAGSLRERGCFWRVVLRQDAELLPAVCSGVSVVIPWLSDLLHLSLGPRAPGEVWCSRRSCEFTPTNPVKAPHFPPRV